MNRSKQRMPVYLKEYKELITPRPLTLAKHQWLLEHLTRYDTTAFCHNRYGVIAIREEKIIEPIK